MIKFSASISQSVFSNLKEKYENISHNEKCGFEISKELAFLPSYFFEPKEDASKTSDQDSGS